MKSVLCIMKQELRNKYKQGGTMNLKTFTKIISLLLINGLTALLIFQLNFAGGKNTPTKAQTATPNYSTTWTPSSCRVIKGSFSGTEIKILLGVAEWQVQYSGEISGKEKWVVPDDPNNPNDGWFDLQQTGTFNNISESKYTNIPCADGTYYHSITGTIPPGKGANYVETYIVNQGNYGFLEYTSKDDDDMSSGGSFPKAWKVCKVNEFADPCS